MPDARRFTGGTLALARSGVGLPEIARRLNRSPASISRYLAGKVQAPQQLFVVLEELAGRSVADEVWGLVYRARERATAANG